MDFHKWTKDNPNIATVNVATPDLNGVLRGKNILSSQLYKLNNGDFRMPFSIQNLDIWGRDIEGSSWVYETGDIDANCIWTGRGPLPVNWLKNKSALIPVTLSLDDGSSFQGDPRSFLKKIMQNYQEKNLKVVVGIELEFYIFEKNKFNNNTEGLEIENAYSINEIDINEEFFNQVRCACEEQNISILSNVSECGSGQFEIVLNHNDDLVKVADDIIFLKYLIKGIAERNNLKASFMPKPTFEGSGSGLHVHLSIWDKNNKNIFNNETQKGSDSLKYALGGLIKTMPELTLIMAPHLNSFRRLALESHAPNIISWGYDNRTTAIRVPSGSNKSRRLEYRVAGSDVNPYLLLSSIAESCLLGLNESLIPPKETKGNAYNSNNKSLPSGWREAIENFKNGSFIKKTFPKELYQMFLDCKLQEYKTLATKITPTELITYLDTV